MSHQVNYAFFDLKGLRPLWEWSWRDLLRRFPKARKRVAELIEFGVPEEETGDVERIVRSETIRRTLSRMTPQLYCVLELADTIPPLRQYAVDTDAWFLEEPSVLVAAAVGGFLEGSVSRSTVRAICKLHSLVSPVSVLKLPAPVRRKLGKLVAPKDLFRPWFGWQGPNCCGYRGTGWARYDLDNCLSVADTRRFIRFFNDAWNHNWSVPFFIEKPRRKPSLFDTVSVEPRKGKAPLFRQFWLMQELARPVFIAERFAQPALAFWMS